MFIDYFLMDVFTDEPLSGNRLAVIIKADDLSGELMQKIAQSFNLSKTVFLSQPFSTRHSASTRIFTPTEEISFSGYPTIGAAVLLGLQQRAASVRLEEKLGLVPCVMDKIDKRTGEAHFKLPQLPEKTGEAPDNIAIAKTLNILPDDIGCDEYQPACYSAGLEYILVPVRTQEVLNSITLERRDWAKAYGDNQMPIYVFTKAQDEPEFDFAARMFKPELRGGEDPATGSAAAALIGMIADKTSNEDGQKSYIVQQGVKMGRPSLLEIQVGISEGKLVHGGIGGRAVIVGEGRLDLHGIK